MIIRTVAAAVVAVILAAGCSAQQPTPPPPSPTPSIETPISIPPDAKVCPERMDKPLQQQLEAVGYSWQGEWSQENLGCVQRWATPDGARYIDMVDLPMETTPYTYHVGTISMAKPMAVEGRKPFLSLWCTASQPYVVRTSLNDFDAAVRVFYQTKQLGQPDQNRISQFAGPQGSTALCFAQEQE